VYRPHLESHTGTRERGIVLPIVAVALLVLFFMAGLGIDFAWLYVVRSEAQRAADAAALAGAKIFAATGCITDGNCTAAQADAIAAAQATASQNAVGGQPAAVRAGDVTFPPSPSTHNPLVQVTVGRTVVRGNGVPTFFMRIFGKQWATVDVAAKATAEAFDPIGQNLGSSCVKPWLLPNCDPNTAHTSSPSNSLCAGGPFATFINPDTGEVSNPGPVSNGGVQGELLTLKPGDPHAAAVPSQYYPLDVPAGPQAALCPACAKSGANGGAALYQQNIECCSSQWITCGPQPAQPETGNMVGPTIHGVDCLINQDGNTGQDILDPDTLLITGGSNNPNPALRGKPTTVSSSVCSIPVYDGIPLCSGQSCGTTVKVIGFMQVFIQREDPKDQGTVEAYILNVGGCGSAAGGGSPPGGGGNPGSTGGSASFVPVRLVQNP
jgi:hypothetical protein